MTSLSALLGSARNASLPTAPRHRVAIGVIALFIIAVMIVFAYISPVLHPAAAALEFSEHGYPLGSMDKNKISRLAPHVMVLGHFSWSDQTEADAVSSITIVPVLVIKDPKLVERICDYGPNMIGIIKRALGHAVSAGGLMSPDALPETLSQVGNTATETINLGLGKVWLRKIYLLHDVRNPVMVAAKTCQILKS